MKVLILVACAVAVASADLYYPQHIPVIGPNGVPVDTPEVQHARAAHLSALAQASTGGYYAASAPIYAAPAVVSNALPADTPEVAAARAQHFADYAVAAQRNGVNVVPVGHVSAYPVDTPEVQLAKAAHFAAHAAARAGHYRRKRQVYYPQHVPVIGPNGVPVDTPEVQNAKAAHYAAYTKALGQAAPYAPVAYGSVYPHAVIGVDGQPVETPEVQLAKAAHFAAHAAVRHY